MTKEVHPYIRFAERFGGPRDEFLNAFTAIVRLEALIEDAKALGGELDHAELPGTGSEFWFSGQIISYYAVGFVTCLEWHARSRMVDLFTYKPSALEPQDLKGQFNDKIIVQMAAMNASVSRLIGASTGVGSFSKYMILMARVFKEIGINMTPYDWLQSSALENSTHSLSSSNLESLENMFTFRNMPVHEIDSSIVGSFGRRDGWSHKEAIDTGHLVISLIKRIESAIFSHAPKDFPNLIDADGNQVSQIPWMKEQITLLENKISAVAEHTKQRYLDRTKSVWLRALRASRAAQAAEERFIDQTCLLRAHYLELRQPLYRDLTSARLLYLRDLYEQIEGELDDDLDGVRT